MTNAHVVKGCSGVRVKLGGKTEAAVVATGDERNDLALIRVSKGYGTPVSFRQDGKIKLGQAVVALGYPLQGVLASNINVTTGIVSSLAGPGEDVRLIQFTAPIQAGNSGGPLLDRAGRLIGVVTSKLSPSWTIKNLNLIPENVNFAIRQSAVRDLLESQSIQFATGSSDLEGAPDDVAASAKNSVVFVECLAVSGSNLLRTTELGEVQMWQRWKSLASGKTFLLRFDGDHLYVEQVLPEEQRQKGAFSSIDMHKQGDSYVGRQRFSCAYTNAWNGPLRLHVNQCQQDSDFRLTRVSPTRIEGRTEAPDPNAKFDCKRCASSKPLIPQTFTWIPE